MIDPDKPLPDDIRRIIREAEAKAAPNVDDEIADIVDRAFAAAEQQQPVRKPILATPFVWQLPWKIPPRQFLYGRHYVRKYLSATIAPGGVGKSALALTEAVAMASGKPILGLQSRPLTVWYWNGEDPIDETQRRIAAACIHHRVAPVDIEGRLFIDSGRETEISMAKGSPRGFVPNEEVKRELIQTIHENGIDVVIIDPFVSSHEVAENDNGQIAAVCKRWAQIADETGCAVEFVHHARKLAAGGSGDVTADDARGASALLAAVRSARTLNTMSKDDAEKAKVEQPRSHVRVDDVKANLAPPAEGAKWFKLVSVPLGNATDHDPQDEVGVVTTWKWPDPNEDVTIADVIAAQDRIASGEWRLDPQSKSWVGLAVAEALDLDPADRGAKSAIKLLIMKWIANGWLRIVKRNDAKRMAREFVEVGERP
ncbi:AAA family ATPase [Bosea vaviloviae]|uniref:AAA family ATPase n=1 Tax=Bosea vaviloviae TaxID=1526658 RepID=UPI000A59D5D5|nr:helicase RepA family protein [Bosea vaviloviae]